MMRLKTVLKAIGGLFVLFVILCVVAVIVSPPSEPAVTETPPAATPTPAAPKAKFKHGDILVAPWSWAFASHEMYPHDIIIVGQVIAAKEDSYVLKFPEYIKDGLLTELPIDKIDESCMRFNGTEEDLRRLLEEYNEDCLRKYDPDYYMTSDEIERLLWEYRKFWHPSA